jgi:hypothetical protein
MEQSRLSGSDLGSLTRIKGRAGLLFPRLPTIIAAAYHSAVDNIPRFNFPPYVCVYACCSPAVLPSSALGYRWDLHHSHLSTSDTHVRVVWLEHVCFMVCLRPLRIWTLSARFDATNRTAIRDPHDSGLCIRNRQTQQPLRTICFLPLFSRSPSLFTPMSSMMACW